AVCVCYAIIVRCNFNQPWFLCNDHASHLAITSLCSCSRCSLGCKKFQYVPCRMDDRLPALLAWNELLHSLDEPVITFNYLVLTSSVELFCCHHLPDSCHGSF